MTEIGLRAQRWRQSTLGTDLAGEVTDESYVTSSSETFQQLRPLKSFVLAGREGEPEVVLQTNSFGLRGPEIVLPKPAGVFRVVCLGDETTLASDLPFEETYCARIEQRLQARTNLNVEVVNAALPGGCPLTGYLLLRQRLIGIQPDVVLLHIDTSDLADDRTARPFTYVGADGVPVAAVHPSSANRNSSSLARLSDEFAVVDWARRRGVAFWEENTADDTARSDPASTDVLDHDTDVAQTLAPLVDIQRLAAGAYCELIVTTTQNPFGSTSSDLAEFTQQQNILHADAAPYLSQPAAQPARRSDRARLTPEEHDVYAAVQAEYIVLHVPGVWTEAPPASIPALPDVARAPAE